MKRIKRILLFLTLFYVSLGVHAQTKNIDANSLSDNLVGYFSFDDNGNGVQSDWGTSKDNAGTLIGGAAFTTADAKYSGSALDINAASGDAYVSFDDLNSNPFVMKGAAAITIACWVQPHQIGTGYDQYIVSTMDDNGGGSHRLELRSDDRFNSFVSIESSNGFAYSAAHKVGQDINLNEWIHVAFVYNSAESKTSIYINGEFSGETVKDGFNLVSFSRKLNLGANVAANRGPVLQNQFDGLIDELYFFDRALSLEEIATLKDIQEPLAEAPTYTASFDFGYDAKIEDIIAVTGDDYYINVPSADREGYTFKGWFSAPNGAGDELSTPTVQVMENVTYYAHWELVNYTITLNKAEEIITENFTITDLPKAIMADTKAGENFVGWFKDNGKEDLLINSEITSIGDVELWSDFTTNATFYTVTLTDAGDVFGQRIAKEERSYLVALPQFSERDNQRFAGWYTEENGEGVRFDIETVITSNITLYAHWTSMASDEGNNLDIDGLSANLIGYFSFDESLEGDVVAQEGSAKGMMGSFMGAGAKLNATDAVYSGSALEIDPTSGAAYVGFDQSNSNPFIMKDASAMTVLCWVKTNELVSEDKYIISTMDDNGGSSYRLNIRNDNRMNTFLPTDGGSGFATSDNHQIGGNLNVDEWIHVAIVYNSAESKTEIFVNGESSGETIKDGFNLNSFDRKLNFGANVATNRNPVIQNQFNGLIDELYFFDRALSQDEIQTIQGLNNPVEPLKEYIAIFDYRDGVNVDTLKTTVLDNYEINTALVATPVREGYNFQGWFTERNGMGEQFDPMSDNILSSDVQYFAHWSLEAYTITLNTANGIETEMFYINDLPKVVAADTKDGAQFLGWYTNEERTQLLVDATITSIGNVELWSSFTAGESFYNVRLSDRGEIINSLLAIEENGYKVNLPTLEVRDDNYRFVGWFTEENGLGQRITTEDAIVADVTVFAHWQAMESSNGINLDINGLSESLVGYFSFDENQAGDVVVDLGTAVGRSGVFVGAGAELVNADAKYSGSALAIDNAYVGFDLANSEELRMGGASNVTVALWVQPHKEGERQFIVSATDDNGGDTHYLEVTNGDRFKGYIASYDADQTPNYSNGNAQSLNHRLNDNLNLNEWVHVAYVYNSAESKTIIYVNGEYSGEYVNTDYDLVTFDTRKFNLGAQVGVTRDPVVQYQFDGLMDELYLFDRALTIDEINTLRDLEKPTAPLLEYIAVFDYDDNANVDTLRATVLDNFEIDPALVGMPEREGYEFQGWFTEKNGAGVAFDPALDIQLSEDAYYYAHWTLKEYTLTLHKANETVTEMYDVSDLPKVLMPDTKEGEFFMGWFKDEARTKLLVDSKITQTGDMELWSGFTADEVFHTITLSDRAQIYATKIATIESGYQLALPKLAAREDNYRFAGWFTGEAGTGMKILHDHVFAQSATLYAHWTPMTSSDDKMLDLDGLSENLVGYFSFDENQNGDVVVDEGTAKGNNGAFVGNGATLSSEAKYTGSALSINNAHVNFDLENSAKFRMEGASAMTVATWVKPTQQGDQYIIAATDENGGDAYRLEIDGGSDRFKAYVATYKEGADPTFSNGNTQSLNHSMKLNEWNHVAYVYNAAESKTSLYVNGEFSGDYVNTDYDLVTFDNRLFNIGAMVAANNSPSVTKQFNGSIDELYMFDRALSSVEIETIKNLATPRQGLLEYIAVFDHGNNMDADTIGTTVLSNYALNLSSLEDPTREHYDFQGWYTERNGQGEMFDAGNPITLEADTTLYAHWTLKEYAITYNVEAGVVNDENPVTFTVEDLPLTLKEPSKVGEYFVSWYSDETTQNRLPFGQITEGKDTEVWSKFSSSPVYQISYYSEGEIVAREYADQDENYEIPTLTREGYTFGGWFKDDGTFEEEFSTIVGLSENISVYAKWDVNQYSISFVTNGGSAVADIIADYNSAISAPAHPTLMNYSFEGWYTDEALTVAYLFPETMPAENTTVYAKWLEDPKYTISFNSNGGSDVESILAYAGANISAPRIPVLEGFSFVGWYKDAGLTTPYIIPPTMPAEDVMLYAKWEESTIFTIIFETNGGSEIEDVYLEVGDVITPPNDPVQDGFVFLGWFEDAELATPFEFPETMPNNNIIVYAKWEEIVQYVITFESNGGTLVESIILFEGEEITAPENPTLDRFEFAGWFADPYFTEAYTIPETMPRGNRTLYAKWVAPSQEWTNGIEITAYSPSCYGTNDGRLVIIAGDQGINVALGNWTFDIAAGEERIMGGLASNIYNLTVSSLANSSSINYEIEIPTVDPIETTASVSGNRIHLSIDGGKAPYTVHIDSQEYTSEDGTIEISNLRPGNYNALVTDGSTCATDHINFTIGNLMVYPNPVTTGTIQAVLPFDAATEKVNATVIGLGGNVIFRKENLATISGRVLKLDVSALPSGNYFLNVQCTATDYTETIQFIVK